MRADENGQGLLFEEPKPHTPGATPSPEILPSAPPGTNNLLKAVREYAGNTGWRLFARTMTDLADDSAKGLDVLRRTRGDELARQVEEARRADVSGEQFRLLKAVFMQANDKLHRERAELAEKLMQTTDPEKVAALRWELEQLKSIQDKVVRSADLDGSSMSGHDLGSRSHGGLIDVGSFRETSEESFLKSISPTLTKDNATPKQLAWAEEQYNKALIARVKAVDQMDTVRRLSEQMTEAYEKGDANRWFKLMKERALERERLAEMDPKAREEMGRFQTIMQYVNEYVISTVFTTKTLMINVIPSAAKLAYRPALDFVVKGADARAFREMTATYAAFGNNMGMAFRKAKFAFDVERGLLNGVNTDIHKTLEQEVKFAGAFGRYLRFFPRVLGATDEFFGHLNYQSFVAAEAAGDAYEMAVAAGRKGKAMTEFINKHVENHVNASWSKPNIPGAVDFLRAVGYKQYSLRGDKLDNWIKTQIDKNGDLFAEAKDTSGKNYANDLAFKREFSSGNAASKAAKAYETFVNGNPWMRVMGQMFFRTPVRVFQEGFRLTPVAQFIDPTFLRDLRGKGPGGVGGYAQVRAQGEAMLSYGIGTAVLTAYATGKITGGGPQDWRQKRDVEGSKTWKPYTLRLSDDFEWDFRNFDPFSTPLKIMTNALDNFGDMQMRKAQGEYVKDPEMELVGIVAVAGKAIFQALKDASLLEGIDQLIDLGSNMMDPEERAEQILRFFGQKAQLAIPNQLQKARQAWEQPAMVDPATPTQFALARFDPSNALLPKRYDALGFTQAQTDPIALITGFDFSTKKERNSALPPEAVYVKNALANLSQLTNKTFIAPYDGKRFAAGLRLQGQDFDLRRERTADGRETYYDRLQRYVNQSTVVDDLYTFFKRMEKQDPVIGVPGKQKEGMFSTQVMNIIQDARNKAYVRLMKEEAELMAKHNAALLEDQNIFTGKRDVNRVIYR